MGNCYENKLKEEEKINILDDYFEQASDNSRFQEEISLPKSALKCLKEVHEPNEEELFLLN